MGSSCRQETSHTGSVLGLGFSPDGNLLASCGGGSVILWDIATRKKLTKWQPFTQGPYCVVFSPDGKTLVVGGNSVYRQPDAPKGLYNPSIVFWDVATQKEIGPKGCTRLSVPRNVDPKSLVFSRDGKLLFVACPDFDLQIMDVATLDYWAYLWGRWQAGKKNKGDATRLT